MNVSSARKIFARRILSGLAGLVLIAVPIMVTAAAADPYNPADDVAAYQAYTAQHGQPMPAPAQYPAPPGYAQRYRLEAQLSYAEAQYNQALQFGNRGAAKHWRKQIRHLRRELSREGRAEGPGYGSGYGAPAYMPPSGYGPRMQQYPPQAPAYAQPYPPTGYPPPGYPNGAAAAFPYGTPGAPGPTGGLSSLLGPLLGGGAASSPAPYPGYPQTGYPNAAAGSQYGAPGATGSMGGLGALLGPLFGVRSTP